MTVYGWSAYTAGLRKRWWWKATVGRYPSGLTINQHCNAQQKCEYILKLRDKISREGKFRLKSAYHHKQEDLRQAVREWTLSKIIFSKKRKNNYSQWKKENLISAQTGLVPITPLAPFRERTKSEDWLAFRQKGWLYSNSNPNYRVLFSSSQKVELFKIPKAGDTLPWGWELEVVEIYSTTHRRERKRFRLQTE